MVAKKRQSNFELLRIIAMFLIILHHSVMHGLILSGVLQAQSIVKRIEITQLALFGKVSVGIFVMITGYFMINSQYSPAKSRKRLKNLWLQLFFYSTLILALALSRHWVVLNWNNGVQAILPVLTNLWWFATVYVLLYVVMPYLNLLLNQLTKQQYSKLVIILLSLGSIYPTFFRNYNAISDSDIDNLLLFVMFYVIGAYFRKYTFKNAHKERKIAWLTFISTLALNLGQASLLGYISYRTSNMLYLERSEALNNTSSITVTLLAVSLFVIFKHINLQFSPTINNLALTTFGIYLIHDHPFIRQKLWYEWFNIPNLFAKYSFGSFVWHVLLIVTLIFISCAAIEWCRLWLFKKLAKTTTLVNKEKIQVILNINK